MVIKTKAFNVVFHKKIIKFWIICLFFFFTILHIPFRIKINWSEKILMD